MSILDCENLETTLKSLSSVFSMSEDEIRNVLCDSEITGEEYGDMDRLFEMFGSERDVFLPDKVCFFHASRVPSDADFSIGIQPLTDVFDQIVNFLFELADPPICRVDWDSFVNGVLTDPADPETIQIRLRYPGPFGFLFSELAEAPEENGCHNYHKTPEIVEAIGVLASVRFGFDFVKAYREHSSPIRIKFSAHVSSPCRHVSKALHYAFIKLNGREDIQISDCSFDGNGNAVDATSILKIEYLIENER